MEGVSLVLCTGRELRCMFHLVAIRPNTNISRMIKRRANLNYFTNKTCHTVCTMRTVRNFWHIWLGWYSNWRQACRNFWGLIPIAWNIGTRVKGATGKCYRNEILSLCSFYEFWVYLDDLEVNVDEIGISSEGLEFIESWKIPIWTRKIQQPIFWISRRWSELQELCCEFDSCWVVIKRQVCDAARLVSLWKSKNNMGSGCKALQSARVFVALASRASVLLLLQWSDWSGT